MHEAGIATAIATTIRERGLPASTVRVVVTGAHHERSVYDDSVRLHMAICDPDLDVDAIRFIHLPSPRLCLSCSGTFSATDPEASCTTCGGVAMPTMDSEVVELEWDEPAPVGAFFDREG
jgi:Zn finger protein HypA/HybF involved in hydrogenase expression